MKLITKKTAYGITVFLCIASLMIFLSACGETGGTAGTISIGQSVGKSVEAKTQASTTGVETVSTTPVNPEETAKTDNRGNYNPQTLPEEQVNLPDAPPDTLPGVEFSSFVTAQMSPDGSKISISFFADNPGYYIVQEKKAASWDTIIEPTFYKGTGGMAAGEIPEGAESLTIRALRIENGSYVAVSKEYTLTRSDVELAGGIKTYSGQ